MLAIIIIFIIIIFYLKYEKSVHGGSFKTALVLFGYKEDEKTCSDLVNIIKSKIHDVYTEDSKIQPDIIICHSIGIIDAIIAQKKYKCPIIAIDTTPNLKSSIYEMKPPVELVQKISTSPDLTELCGDFILLRRYNPKVASIISKSDNYMIEKYPGKFKIINLPQEATHYIWRTEIGKNELLKLL